MRKIQPTGAKCRISRALLSFSLSRQRTAEEFSCLSSGNVQGQHSIEALVKHNSPRKLPLGCGSKNKDTGGPKDFIREGCQHSADGLHDNLTLNKIKKHTLVLLCNICALDYTSFCISVDIVSNRYHLVSRTFLFFGFLSCNGRIQLSKIYIFCSILQGYPTRSK